MVGTFTESTLLDVVSDDGGAGFMMRIARHVDEGVAWLWLVTFGPEGVHGFVDDELPCNSMRTQDDGSQAQYEVSLPSTHGSVGWIMRTGSGCPSWTGFDRDRTVCFIYSAVRSRGQQSARPHRVDSTSRSRHRDRREVTFHQRVWTVSRATARCPTLRYSIHLCLVEIS